jgi:hypothetical protein
VNRQESRNGTCQTHRVPSRPPGLLVLAVHSHSADVHALDSFSFASPWSHVLDGAFSYARAHLLDGAFAYARVSSSYDGFYRALRWRRQSRAP